jgi:hypothetical protein
MPKSKLELEFEELWLTLYPELDLVNEFRPIPKRRFRADYAHLPSKVLIEINGGTWVKNGHSSGSGIERDYTKSNLCILHGYVTFQLSSGMITEEWLNIIGETIKGREAFNIAYLKA